jgi:hypothetical protein
MQSAEQASVERPEVVPGLDAGPLRLTDLPEPGTRRWTGLRKVQVLGAVRGGLITRDEAWNRYGLTETELNNWDAQYQTSGVRGLYLPRTKKVRGEPGHTEQRTRGWTIRLSLEPARKDGNLIVEPSERLISYGNASAKLLEMQMMILIELMKRPEDIVSKQVLLNAIWADHGIMPSHRVLDVGICHLRKRLYAVSERTWIETEWGRGYRWKSE